MNTRSKTAERSFPVGCRVVAVSGWTGVVVKINHKNPGSPLRVKWDKNGEESNENCMSVKRDEAV
jgi:hypothetical protein